MKHNEYVKIVSAPNGAQNPLYRVMKKAVKATNIRRILIGTKEEVLTRVSKMNAKNRQFTMPTDKKAHYTDHPVQGKYHCPEINMTAKRKKKAVLFVFGGGMIIGSDKGDIVLSRRIASETNTDIWFPYYPLCHEHDMLENVRMIYECYAKMLQFYRPENIVFLGFSSGGALILDLITYINELNDNGRNIPMPGLLIPVSPASIPVTEAERERIRKLDSRDVMIPASYFDLADDIMRHGHTIPKKYIATAHGDFRNAPMTHFYYGSAENVYAFAPSYAESYRKAGAKCVIHVGKGMHHCYALQPSVPGCLAAFEEIMQLIRNYQKDDSPSITNHIPIEDLPYCKQIRQWLKEKYGDQSEKIWNKTVHQYNHYLEDCPDYGGRKNGHAKAIYGGLLVFAWYNSLPDQPPIAELQPFVQELFMSSFTKLGKIFDLNRHLDMSLIDRIFRQSGNRDRKDIRKYPAGFVNVDEPYDGKKQIARYHFTQCPNAEFAKKHGLLHVLPLLCNSDYFGIEQLHGKLIRHGTCGNSTSCDYCVVGNRNPLAEKFDTVMDENGFLVSKEVR